jgi:plastocyanin
LDTTLLVTGGGNGGNGDVYATSCNCEFSRDYDPFADPQGTVWQVVAADEVPEGATTAPLEEAGAEPSPAPEGSPAASPAETAAPGTPAPESPPAETEAPASPPAETPAGSPAPESPAPGSPAASPGGEGATITMVDMAFEPSEFSISPDTPTPVAFSNQGAALHNFTIDELAIDVDVEPASTEDTDINAPQGTYTFYCNVPGHRDAGMEGTLTVE